MKMHISSPALVFEEKSGEKKGGYYASKCSKLSRNVCNLIHSKDQLQRITLLESQTCTPRYTTTPVRRPVKWLDDLKSLSLKSGKSAQTDAEDSEEQKRVAVDQCPGPDLTQINSEQRRSKMETKHQPDLALWAAKQKGAAAQKWRPRLLVSQVRVWPLPPSGQLSEFPRSWALLTADGCPPCTRLV